MGFIQTLVILLLVSASTARAAICPLTGREANATTVPPTRCLDADAQTCCSPCTDLDVALFTATMSLGTLVSGFIPGPVGSIPALQATKACTLFEGFRNCEKNLEAIICALTCNPDSGSYISVQGGGTNVTAAVALCSAFGQAAYSSCAGVRLSIPGLGDLGTLGALYATPTEFFNSALSGLSVAGGGPQLNVSLVNSTTGCYGGPKKALPAASVCCDPLTITPTCASTVNASDYNMTGRTYLTSPSCLAAAAPAPVASTPAPTTAGTAVTNTSGTPASGAVSSEFIAWRVLGLALAGFVGVAALLR